MQEAAQPQLAVIRKRDRLQLPERAGGKASAYIFEASTSPLPNASLNLLCGVPREGVTSQMHHHEGAELIYVVRGKLALTVEKNEMILAAEDAMYFARHRARLAEKGFVQAT